MNPAPTRSSSPTPPKPRLLIVDDEPLVGNMLKRLMRRKYDVTTTTSGQEGLRLATTQDWDAILCDIMMPELSGPEFLRRLESEREELVACLGFMTGGAFDKETRAFLDQRGEEGWLSKPFRYDEVKGFVEKLRETGAAAH